MKIKFDRRLIYILVIICVSIPLLTGFTLPAVRMKSADKAYQLVENLKLSQNEIVFVALDFGPNSKAENLPQAETFIEHLMRKRLRFALFSQYALAEGFLKSIPERVAKKLNEETKETWLYGKDWVNLGYRPGSTIFIQNIAKSKNLVESFQKDAQGNNLSSLSAFSGVKNLKDVKLFAEFTGLTGTFDTYVQFFKNDGYSPDFIHGCTSITIPDAYIYLDSGQLKGLFEGLAGAAWYSSLLDQNFKNRITDSAALINTALAVGHLVILGLIIIGNLSEYISFGGRKS